jgi:CRP/FNR family cyclic AMP-dependent transcriptional regulator
MGTSYLVDDSLARAGCLEYNRKTAKGKSESRRATMLQLSFLRQIPLFANLAESELQALVDDFVPRTLRQGDIVFHQGDPGQTLYLIGAGKVRIYVLQEDGQEMSVVLLGPGDILGEFALIDDLPRSASAVAMQDTLLFALTRERYREHLRRCPQLALNFLKILSIKLRYTTDQAGILASLDIGSRIARKLLELAQGYGVAEPDGVRIDAPLTQEELASMVGATRESTNKTLGAFRRRGLIKLQGGYIYIVDPEGLRDRLPRS